MPHMRSVLNILRVEEADAKRLGTDQGHALSPARSAWTSIDRAGYGRTKASAITCRMDFV
jgi:hypothetical protein